MALRRWLATSEHPVARLARGVRRAPGMVSLPLPGWVFLPWRLVYTGVRGCWYFVARVFIAEPIFRTYCTRVGRRFRCGVYVHWVQGRGDIFIGDDVLLDGRISFAFAARFRDRPTLRIGDRSGIGHRCTFVIADSITIGNDCRIATGSQFRDSPGHPVDAGARRRGEPPPPEAVKPIVIEDDVWIGASVIVQAGVRIGRGSVISSRAVVLSDVPPCSLMAGNPARRIGSLAPSDATAAPVAPPAPAASIPTS
jgi:acetyltransferase-like isoleucine patch superfamily enzyme